MSPTTSFLLSPASLDGVRGRLLRSAKARFALAQRLRAEGAPIGEAFAFLSALYFRGKLAYARRFAPAPGGVRVIAPGFGLVEPEWRLDPRRVRRMRAVGVDPGRRAYRHPLATQASALAAERVVLLGSLATGKYLDVLLPALGERLWYPTDFVGMGDMRRGSLLLRAASSGEELDYSPAQGLQWRRVGRQ